MTGDMRGGGRGRKVVRQAIDSAAPVLAKASAGSDADQSHVTWPFGFAMRADGLYRLPTKEDQKEFRICDPFQVIGETRPDDGKGWGLLLRWQDRDGRVHDWIVPRAQLQADAGEVRARLAACTLDVRPINDARRRLPGSPGRGAQRSARAHGAARRLAPAASRCRQFRAAGRGAWRAARRRGGAA